MKCARDLPMTTQVIDTPLAEMEAPILKGKKLVIVSVLRAGNGLLEGMLSLIPSERVGHIGHLPQSRDIAASGILPEGSRGYCGAADDRCLIPCSATGNSVSAAVTRLKEEGCA